MVKVCEGQLSKPLQLQCSKPPPRSATHLARSTKQKALHAFQLRLEGWCDPKCCHDDLLLEATLEILEGQAGSSILRICMPTRAFAPPPPGFLLTRPPGTNLWSRDGRLVGGLACPRASLIGAGAEAPFRLDLQILSGHQGLKRLNPTWSLSPLFVAQCSVTLTCWKRILETWGHPTFKC